MKTFHFLAGLPRSGSTVLASLLNQNSEIYVTPTSPMLDLLFLNEQAWRNCPSVVANPFPEQVPNISYAIINGCWEHVSQPIIIDKHRAWGRNVGAIEQIFGPDAKLIITVRDIPSIIASFFTLLRKSEQNPNFIDAILIQKNLPLTDENRADILWNDFIHDTWDSFLTGYSNNKEKLLLVDYDDLVNDPSEELEKIYKFLKIPKIIHDTENIECKTKDDDLMAWGIEGLHTIRPQLKKISKTPKEILGDDIYNKYKNMNLEFWT